MIFERGIAATRIADIAERAGTSSGGVLYWFESKDQLLTEALTDAETRFAEELSARLAPIRSPSSKLLALIEGSVTGEEWALWIELWVRARHDPVVAQARQRLDDDWRGLIERIVRDGTEGGEFAPESIGLASLALAGMIDGLAIQMTLRDWTINSSHMLEVCISAANRLLGVDLRAAAGEQAHASAGAAGR